MAREGDGPLTVQRAAVVEHDVDDQGLTERLLHFGRGGIARRAELAQQEHLMGCVLRDRRQVERRRRPVSRPSTSTEPTPDQRSRIFDGVDHLVGGADRVRRARPQRSSRSGRTGAPRSAISMAPRVLRSARNASRPSITAIALIGPTPTARTSRSSAVRGRRARVRADRGCSASCASLPPSLPSLLVAILASDTDPVDAPASRRMTTTPCRHRPRGPAGAWSAGWRTSDS